ncbi:MAG: Holliday junction resolvase RuvX [Chloroflexi bacterium]|nr:Holliday junction resolvase RuvX [Chloroflexota bacterium]MBP8056426.1 Holliday junction resolvase RuvX [Chloroflexota bacterium]
MSFTLTNSPLPGPVLAIDLGEKRIGLAVSDSGRMIARSYGVIERKSRREDFARFQAIISEQKVTLVVMGLPLHLDGSDSATTTWVRDYTAALAQNISVPVTLWDERYSSQAATASLTERGVRAKKQKGRVDAVAAAFILQSYLDTQTGPYTAQ